MTTKSNTRKTKTAAIVFAGIAALAMPAAFAERNIGKHSQSEIRNACNKAGGQLLGISDSGSYGCEVESTGALILCNKDENCTAFLPARSQADRNKVLSALKLDAKTAAK